MADDKMEICPARYGDDFDFDFDLTAPFEDQDTILEDLISTGCSVASQASYSLLNDDNDDKSIEEYDDLEALPDSKNSKNDHDNMPLTNGNDPNLVVTQKTTEHNRYLTYQENVWRDQPEPENSTNEGIENNIIRQEMWEIEESFATNSKNDFKQDSQASPPNHENLQNDISVQQFESAMKSTSIKPLTAGDVNESSDRNEGFNETDSLVPSSPSESPNFLFRSETTGENSDLSDVIVVYQSNEYLLFSTSEFDDPNTFFIKDRTIAQKPLCDFFWAIRNVIYEDIENESELWLFFPEFGLQIEETSSLLENVTFLELVNLRKKLLLNDGIHIIQPMYIDLGFRKNFVKELMRITKNANDGKGLSESVIWNENNEDPKGFIATEGGSPPPSENQSIHSESTIDEQLEEENSSFETEQVNEVNLHENEEDNQIPEKTLRHEPEQVLKSQNEPGSIVTGETSTNRNHHELRPTRLSRNENISHVKLKITEPVFNITDPESDTIDYSEDDLEDCKNPAINLGSVINDNKIKPILIQKTESKLFFKSQEEYTNMKIGKNINVQGSEPKIDDQYNLNQENNSESPFESTTDLITHVDIQSDDKQVNFASIDKGAMGEQANNKKQKNLSRGNTIRNSGQTKENLTVHINRDVPKGDKLNISGLSIDNRIETSAVIDSIIVSKALIKPKPSSDRCNENTSVDQKQEQNIPSPKISGNEDENEINYEEEEEEEEKDKNEDGINKKYLSPRSIIKPVNTIPLSIIGKRPRIDCKFEANMEKIDRKRNRS
ncbi:hypothetical protein HI914_05537 [Erysiphe necator]|nr:hypothetical protein HI914_05537 [Erysiphe necator]